MAIQLSNRVSQSDFGALVGVSRQAIGDMISRGILDPNESGEKMLLAYCSHLREVAAGRLASGDLDLAAERAGLAKAQRERIEMANAEKRMELAPVVLIEEVLTKTAAKIAGVFDAIPGKVRRRFPSIPTEAIRVIAAEIAAARNTVASMSLSYVLGTAQEGGDSDDIGPSRPLQEEGKEEENGANQDGLGEV